MTASLTAMLTLSVFPVLLVAAGIGDFLTMRIPNWLNGAIIVAFVVMIFVAGMPFDQVKWHLLSGLIVLIGGLVLFFSIHFGGGDAKMLAAASLWIGWSQLLPFLLYTAIAGGALALAAIIWRRIGHEHDSRGGVWLTNLFNKEVKIPYGVAIAIGGIAAFPGTWWVQSIT